MSKFLTLISHSKEGVNEYLSQKNNKSEDELKSFILDSSTKSVLEGIEKNIDMAIVYYFLNKNLLTKNVSDNKISNIDADKILDAFKEKLEDVIPVFNDEMTFIESLNINE